MHYMHYMHYKDYIHHDFYVYSPVLLTQYLGHCWHTPCTELYILRISAWLLRKPPLPCHRGGGEPSGWGRGGVGVPAHIYIYMYYVIYYLRARHGLFHHAVEKATNVAMVILSRRSPMKWLEDSWAFIIC